ncbi:unnamed protein product, partial [Onchocerca flexuosa]|uniref:Titin-like n=1 Tax=Onchocerca flexuosa TaxID=387005 RepID=A0A183HV27_9BILA
MERIISEEVAAKETTSEAKSTVEKEVEMRDLKESVESATDLKKHDVFELEVEKTEKETFSEITRPGEEKMDELLVKNEAKVGKSDTVEVKERKPKKIKGKKFPKEDKPSEEMIPTEQQKSVEITTKEMEYGKKLDKNKSKGKEEHAEETIPSIIEEKDFKEKVDKKVSQEEKKSAGAVTEFEVKENFVIKHEKEKADIVEVSESVGIDKKAEEVVSEENSASKKRKEIKKRKSSKEKGPPTADKKAEESMIAVEIADKSFGVQLQQQDIIVEEMVTSEKAKVEAEKEVKKDDLEERHPEDKLKVKKKTKKREEKREEIVETVSVDVSFKNISKVENVDKVI